MFDSYLSGIALGVFGLALTVSFEGMALNANEKTKKIGYFAFVCAIILFVMGAVAMTTAYPTMGTIVLWWMDLIIGFVVLIFMITVAINIVRKPNKQQNNHK